MKRRRRRRRRSPLPRLALLVVALGVVVLVVSRMMRPIPHPAHVAHHVHRPAAVASGDTAAGASSASPHAATARARTAASVAPGAAEKSASNDDIPAVGTPAAAPPAASSSAPPAPARAKLAIIIDDCGQWPVTERGFIALPLPLTLSVLPHVRYGAEIAHDADAAGKGVMLHLPMEPLSGIDPGPGRITVAMGDAAIAAQVRDDLASVPLARGVNNHEGSRATQDDRVMRDVAAVLASEHLFFIDSRTSGTSVAERDAKDAGVATAGRDVFLDNRADVAATEAQLREAARLAERNGSAIAIGHPRPTTLEALRALYPSLQADGISFVLASDLVR